MSCASCERVDQNNYVKSLSRKKPKWLIPKDYVREFIGSSKSFSNVQKHTYLTSLQVPSLYNGRKILYWAALPASISLDAKSAYDKFQNHGIARVKNGKIDIHLQMPQSYYVLPKKQTFPPHFHFVFSNKTNTKWNSQIYTKNVPFSLNKQLTKKRRKLN